jgi:histidinol-phosphate aminotransferase
VSQDDLRSLLLPQFAGMEPYTPILPFEVLSRQLDRAPEAIVKLDANENPYGPAPAVRAALAEYPFLHIYPDPEHRLLREALADYTGQPAANILAGQGADELIDLICRLFLSPGDAIIDCPPTFGMYRFDAGLEGAKVIEVPRRADFSIDVDAVEAAARAYPAAKLLFLTSPNNPDGSLLDPAGLARLLTLPLMVVLDEAYVEFAGPDCSRVSWVRQHTNLIVLRTFSKWAGLAGLRLGYGIFPDWLMPILWQAKQPYNVTVPAAVAGVTSLAHRAAIWPTVEALIAERARLERELARVPYLRPYPSRANFVLCRVMGRDAAELKAGLAQEGILVRYFARPGLENCIRVSAGRPSDTDALLAALNRV